MDLVQKAADLLKRLGATDVQVTRNDSNTEYERQHRITSVSSRAAHTRWMWALSVNMAALASSAVTANQPLHLTAAALRFFEVQHLTSRRGR